MANRRRSRCQACALLVVANSIRASLAFAPSLVARSPATSTCSPAGTSPATWSLSTATAAARAVAVVGPLRAVAYEDEEDDGEELVGMAEFLAQKAVRDRQQMAGQLPPPPSPIADDDDEELVGMAEFLAQKAVRDRQMGQERPRPSPSPMIAGEDEDDGEELVGMADFFAQKSERDRRMAERQSPLPGVSSTPGAAPVDLGMEGGIFPSDVFPGSASDEITLQGAKLKPGQPEAVVGFWKVRWATCSRLACSSWYNSSCVESMHDNGSSAVVIITIGSSLLLQKGKAEYLYYLVSQKTPGPTRVYKKKRNEAHDAPDR